MERTWKEGVVADLKSKILNEDNWYPCRFETGTPRIKVRNITA
jgi:hypothetical protein